MLRLFWRKMFFEKCFWHFSVFGGGKNSSHPVDFHLTKNDLPFLIS
jgi:hypothetical protein